MEDAKEVEVEPPMHLQRPSSGRSQDVSHILSSVFRELFTRDVVGEQRVKHLATSRSGEEGYHDKYVQQLRKIQEERDRCHKEADMLEAHIMQSQAAAMVADERDLQKAAGECEDYRGLGLPPGKSNLRHCLDTQLLRKFHLIVPEDFTTDEHSSVRPPQAGDIPSYARCTTSSQQRYRKTPPLTDYMDDLGTSSLTYPFTGSKQTSIAAERKHIESPPPATSKTKHSKSSSWKDSMKPNQRKIERDDLQRLQSKAEYKRNPRFVPPLAADLIQGKSKDRNKKKMCEEKKESTGKPVDVFIASPNPLVFADYKVGEVYELVVELKNVTSSSRQVRVVPPSTNHFSVGLGKFPGENGVVAPGMSCVYPIRFAPDSLADYDDVIKIKSQVDPAMTIPLQARRPPPLLSLSPVLGCGHTLVGGKKVVRMYCSNSGGDGRFCLMPKADWPTSTFNWSGVNPGSIEVAPFEIRPAMFELKRGQSTTLEITFRPYAATFFKQEIIMVCDNCHIKVFSIEGTGQMAAIQFLSITGGLSDHDVGEMRDVSAKFLVRFEDQNPNTHHEKTLTFKNTTNVALPFRWKLFNPILENPTSVRKAIRSSAHTQRTPDEYGVFSISPNMGTLPPHEIVHFSLEHSPKQVGSFHSVSHLVLEEIPTHDGERSQLAARDATAIEIEIKAQSKPFSVQVSPPTLSVAGTLMLGTPYIYPVTIQNHSVSEVEFEWQEFDDERCNISIEPRRSVLGAGEVTELQAVVIGHVPGTIDETVSCHVPHTSTPVYVHVRVSFEGPEVAMETCDIAFGLVRLGESSTREIPIKNRSNIKAEWTVEECIDCCIQSISQYTGSGEYPPEFAFVPPSGVLEPGEDATVSVTFTPSDCRRVRTVFQCEARNGKTSFLSVFSEVQTPLACLVSSSLYIEDVYLDVPVTREVVLLNQTLLRTEFRWNELVGEECTVTFEPSSGVLQPREALPVRVTLTGHRKGPLDSLMTSCHVTGMDKPVWLAISTVVRGLNVTFETPKLFDLHRPDDLKTVDIENHRLLLNFDTLPLGEQSKVTLVMTNTSAMRARYTLHVEHFSAAKPPTPPGGPSQNRGGRHLHGLLARTPNIADPLSKTTAKAYADYCSAILRDGRGAAFVPSPSTGELLPFGYQVIELTAYNDMWGEYSDLLVCAVEGLEPVFIPINMSVVGCPLNFQMMKDQSPILRFGTQVSGAPTTKRSLRVNNTSPFAIRLDWDTYNLEEDDPQLVDMLVHFGRPLPIYDKKGQELLPPPPECEFPCEEIPFIQVKLSEHDGNRSDKPFDVTPRQQVIPAKGNASMTVTFTPYTNNPEGDECLSYAAAYMSLDGERVEIPGQVSRTQGMEMTRFRLDVTANIKPALLSIEMEEDKGTHFSTAASDLLKGDATKVHRFVMSNTTETPLSLKFDVASPFSLLLTEPPPSAKSTRSQANGMMTIKPGKNTEIKVGFCLTADLLARVNEIPAGEERDGTLLVVQESGDRKLIFKQNLVVQFSNKSTQILPLTASVSVPTLRLSKEVLDFGVCLVGQEKELEVTLFNPTESQTTWVVERDCRYPEISRNVFSVTPSEGFLDAYVSHVAENKILLKVTFIARHNVEYECVLLFRGRLQEEVQRLILKGNGSYDGRHESLVNVITVF